MAQWWWCETEPYDEAVSTEVLCNIYMYQQSQKFLFWQAITNSMDDIAKVKDNEQPSLHLNGGSRKLAKSNLTFDDATGDAI